MRILTATIGAASLAAAVLLLPAAGTALADASHDCHSAGLGVLDCVSVIDFSHQNDNSYGSYDDFDYPSNSYNRTVSNTVDP